MKLEEVKERLKNGEVIVLSKVRNRYNEEIADEEIYIQNGLLMHSYITCYSSSSLGLGTCGCVSHNSIKIEWISLCDAIKRLNDYIEKENKKIEEIKDEKKEIEKFLNGEA